MKERKKESEQKRSSTYCRTSTIALTDDESDRFGDCAKIWRFYRTFHRCKSEKELPAGLCKTEFATMDPCLAILHMSIGCFTHGDLKIRVHKTKISRRRRMVPGLIKISEFRGPDSAESRKYGIKSQQSQEYVKSKRLHCREISKQKST